VPNPREAGWAPTPVELRRRRRMLNVLLFGYRWQYPLFQVHGRFGRAPGELVPRSAAGRPSLSSEEKL
jgi:hypothetical protein